MLLGRRLNVQHQRTDRIAGYRKQPFSRAANPAVDHHSPAVACPVPCLIEHLCRYVHPDVGESAAADDLHGHRTRIGVVVSLHSADRTNKFLLDARSGPCLQPLRNVRDALARGRRDRDLLADLRSPSTSWRPVELCAELVDRLLG